ncbi:MAG: hypothetical protein ACTSO9_12280 [Candidatus Helarchaeota archaeon]
MAESWENILSIIAFIAAIVSLVFGIFIVTNLLFLSEKLQFANLQFIIAAVLFATW